jgi:hypothetical protein
MKHNRRISAIRVFAGLLISMLFASLAVPLGAQTAPESRSERPSSYGYDKAHEITLNGTIQEVVAKSAAGTPVGMHLLVEAPQGTVDAHLGPYMTREIQEALHTGTPVQIVGAMVTVRGKSYLLARQITFGGRMVVVRSENGYLTRSHSPRPSRTNAQNSLQRTTEPNVNGGGR